MNMFYTLVSPSSSGVCRFSYRNVGVLAAALLAMCAVDAHAQTWVNPDVTNPPGATQGWSIGSNWSGGAAPLAGVGVSVFRTGNLAASVLLDTQSNDVGVTSVNYGSHLLINSSGELRNGLSGRLDIGSGAASTVTVLAGGQITLADGVLGSNVRLQLQNGSTLNTAGVINHNVLTVQGGSTVNMTGGSITTRQGNDAIVVAGSTFNQSAGAIIANDLQLQAGGLYRVSGGSITTSSANSGLYFRSATVSVGSRFEVRGSGASLNFSSFRNNDTGVDIVRPTFAFVLDNSSQHISTINLAANGTSGATLRANADIEVSLAGGVLLSGTDSYTVIQRVSGTDTAWNNAASLTGLWVDATDNTSSSTKAQIKVGLNAAVFQGNLDALGDSPLSFGPATHGYVTLDGVGGQSFQLALDIAGGTLANFTSALTEAGIGWTAGTGDYEVILNLGAAISGGNYFAWDFSMIDNAMGLQGVEFVAVPEPSSFAALAGLGVLGVVMLRRRRA